MNCRAFRRAVLTARAADRTGAQLELIALHEQRCAACARLRAQVDALEGALQAIPPAAPPEGFTGAVMCRLPQAEQSPRGSWVDRVFGPLRPPAPLVTLQQAVAAAALLLMLGSVGMLLGHTRLQQPSAPAAVVAVAERPGGSVIEVDQEFINELIIRHQGAAAMQPLSDGDGMRLVAY